MPQSTSLIKRKRVWMKKRKKNRVTIPPHPTSRILYKSSESEHFFRTGQKRILTCPPLARPATRQSRSSALARSPPRSCTAKHATFFSLVPGQWGVLIKCNGFTEMNARHQGCTFLSWTQPECKWLLMAYLRVPVVGFGCGHCWLVWNGQNRDERRRPICENEWRLDTVVEEDCCQVTLLYVRRHAYPTHLASPRSDAGRGPYWPAVV